MPWGAGFLGLLETPCRAPCAGDGKKSYLGEFLEALKVSGANERVSVNGQSEAPGLGDVPIVNFEANGVRE